MTPEEAGLVFVTPAAYADEAWFDEACAVLRREDPIHLVEHPEYAPFHVITKHADVLEIELHHHQWHNAPRPVISNLEADRRREEQGDLLRTLIHMDEPDHRAYRAVTSELFERGVVHLSALEVGDDILATHWGLMFGDRFYSIMLAFAEHPLARYSPGRLLIEHLVEWCFARGLRAFDLGVGDMEWKQHFKPVRTPLCHLSLAANPVGWTYLEARKIRNELRVRGLPGAPPKAA